MWVHVGSQEAPNTRKLCLTEAPTVAFKSGKNCIPLRQTSIYAFPKSWSGWIPWVYIIRILANIFKANIEKEPIYPLHTGQRTLSKPQKINAFGTQSSCPYGQRVNACGSFYSEKSSIDGLDWSFLSDWGLRPELAVDSGEQKVGRSLSSWKNKSCSTKMLGKYVREKKKKKYYKSWIFVDQNHPGSYP